MKIYLFSPIPYSFLHQRPQKLADHFAALSIPVTYIEPCGLGEYRSGRKKGLARLLVASAWYLFLGLWTSLLPRGARRKRTPRTSRPAAAAIRIVAMPLVFPHNRADSPVLERFNATVYRRALENRVLRDVPADEESLAIVQHPFWGRVLRRGDFTRIAYDCIDELSLFSGKSSLARAEQSQKQLLAISDVVFATAEKLEDNLRPKSAPVPLLRIPNGVDSAWFQSQASMHPAPGDVRSLRKPVVGYVGVLRGWFDYELVGWLAREMPDVSFVMVGPVDFEWRLAALRGIENLHWLGRREYRDMPLYIQSFDVCLIPFLAGDVSMTTNPVKVLEYFALGKPVVSTPLHELEGYRNEKLLWMAESRDEFAAALREALAESNAIAGERRRQVARAHEWRSLARTMLDALGAPMGARP